MGLGISEDIVCIFLGILIVYNNTLFSSVSTKKHALSLSLLSTAGNCNIFSALGRSYDET